MPNMLLSVFCDLKLLVGCINSILWVPSCTYTNSVNKYSSNQRDASGSR